MTARRCSTCLVNWPPNLTKCPTCGGATNYEPFKEPNDDWYELRELARLVRTLSDADDEVMKTVRGSLQLLGGGLTLSSHDVVRSGILSRLATDDIVKVITPDGTEQCVEIVGYSYTDRIYAVRLFETSFPAYVPESWLPKKRRKRKTTSE